tara:strand:+ start:1036 stop:1794 length:759 start_codon:yes stop_codon:yes gene_type:complete
MQMIGKLAPAGFAVKELEAIADQLSQYGQVDLHHLAVLLPNELQATADPAAVLVIRGGVNLLLAKLPELLEAPEDALLCETRTQRFDERALMGRGSNRSVKHKRARHNNCYADFEQEPDYPAGKGTVVPFASAPLLAALRSALSARLGPKAAHLVAETNKYFDTRKCGIGWHGDSERRIVVGVRLGASSEMPLKFSWFQRSAPVGAVFEVPLEHGDIYVMSEKATGWDWMSNRKGLTLRHAAGAAKYAANKQ